jgi:putative membrane protein
MDGTPAPGEAPAVPGPPRVTDPVIVEIPPEARVLDVPNEAVPDVLPPAAKAAQGSIPAAEARRIWARVQALNWRLYLVRILAAGLAAVLTVALLPGLGFSGWDWGQFLGIAVVFGVLNATIKPALQFLTLRFIFNTYGVVVILINAVLLALLGRIMEGTFEVYRPVALLAGGLVVGVLGMAFETLLGANPPVLDRDYKERNGLK